MLRLPLSLLLVVCAVLAGLALHRASSDAPAVGSPAANPPAVVESRAAELQSAPRSVDEAPSRAAPPAVEASSVASFSVNLRSLDEAQGRAYRRLQQVLKERALPPLPNEGTIGSEDLAALVSAVVEFDGDVERTYTDMARKSSEYVVACEKEILQLLELGRAPPYEVFTGQKLKDDTTSFVSVMFPANQTQRYIIRTPESKVANEKAAWIASVTTEAEFADKVARHMIQR